ncbi:hypothetical protein CSPX01_16949 [Colletotrichum filicis]|nr:hypothetical protein CSPX01_16949 [Colletotrichum filicis]
MFWSGQVEYAEQCIMGSGQLKLFVDGQGLAAIGALEDRRLNLTWGQVKDNRPAQLKNTGLRRHWANGRLRAEIKADLT